MKELLIFATGFTAGAVLAYLYAQRLIAKAKAEAQYFESRLNQAISTAKSEIKQKL